MEKILNFLKNKGVLLVILLVCLNLYTCTRSCTNSRHVKKDLSTTISELDSLNVLLGEKTKMIDSLEKELSVAKTENKGLQKSIEIQNDAINQISAAKKNIHVTVKEKK